MPTIEKAKMDRPILRKELAKMISVFATELAGHIPDNNKICEFPDIDRESEEMKYYIRLSCKL